MAPSAQRAPGKSAGPSLVLYHFHAPFRAWEYCPCLHAMAGSVEPMQASLGKSTWVPYAAICTLASSHFFELYPGMKI